MTKILKAVMFTRLYDRFPQIKSISKIGFPPDLAIHCQSPILEEGTENVHSYRFSIRVACVHPGGREEPYTQETLERAIQEFPIEYKKKLKEDFNI